MASLEAKYGGAKKSKQTNAEYEEPSEAEFAAAASRVASGRGRTKKTAKKAR